MKEKYLVIGSNSFSGSDFVDLLLEDPSREVLGVSRSPEKGEVSLAYKKNKNLKNFQFFQFDLNGDHEKIVDLIDREKPEYVVNFAAQSEVGPSWKNPAHWYQTNVVSIGKLAHALKDRKFVKRYMHISSPEVYGNCQGTIKEDAPLNPSTPYAASKAGGDLTLLPYVKNFDFPLVMIRATNVYGPHQQLFKIIPRSAIRIKKGETIELHGGGVAVKSYIHIRDVSKGELAALHKGKKGEIYHLSPDRGYSVKEVVQNICQLMGVPFEKATRAVEERLGQDAAYVIDSTKARTELGWKPEISIEEGIRQTVNWVNDYWKEIEKMPHEYIHQA